MKFSQLFLRKITGIGTVQISNFKAKNPAGGSYSTPLRGREGRGMGGERDGREESRSWRNGRGGEVGERKGLSHQSKSLALSAVYIVKTM